MLSEIGNALYVIYIVILIILTLIILYSFMYPDGYNKWVSGDKNTSEIINDEEEDDIEDDVEESLAFNQYENKTLNIKIAKYESVDEDYYSTSESGMFNYEDLIKSIEDNNFLLDYKHALKTSFEEKIKKYNTILLHIDKDIKSHESKYSATDVYKSHDVTLQRLLKIRNEIDNIIAIINHRLSNLSTRLIQKNLRLMINNKKKGFKSLVGRDEIKNKISLIIYTFTKNPRTFTDNFQNMVITGKSGVGKTKLAETLGYIFSKSGILSRNKFRSIGAQDLSTKFVNDSAQITAEYFMSCLEGILYIDEAYQLAAGKMFGEAINHNDEVITELVRLTGEYVGLSIVMVGGYKREMNKFINANKGISGRFPHQLHLSKYSSEQLTDILIKFLNNTNKDISITQEDADNIYSLIDRLYTRDHKIFNFQARDMQNLSAHISRSINGNKNIKWKYGNIDENLKLITSGFKTYLRPKGLHIS